MKILSLDISTKTGWALSEVKDGKFNLIEYGICKKRNIKDYDYEYPRNYLKLSYECADDIVGLYKKFNPDILVIEETSKGSKNAMSQKILEFIHCHIALFICVNDIKRHYFMTGEWRNICSCKMNLNEKAQNKNVKKQRNTGITIAKNEEGKRIGKITKKHVNVRRANELFDLELKLKDEDKADAILLNYAYYLKFGGQNV